MPSPILGLAGAGAAGTGTALALGAASLGGALISSNAAKKGAQAQAAASEEANATQLAIYNDQTERQEPWRKAGQNALGFLEDAAGTRNSARALREFEKSPGYQFRMDEGLNALNNRASASGLRLSGQSLKAANDYAQNTASAEFGNYFNRIAGLAGVGQTANQSLDASGRSYANAFGQNAMAAGNARASGYQGQANAFNSGINNGMQIYGAQQAGYFNQPSGGSNWLFGGNSWG